MYAGLKPHLLSLLRCPHDHGPLVLASAEQENGGAVLRGTVSCQSCKANFEIADGILILRVATEAHAESRNEEQQRDRDARQAGFEWEEEGTSAAEVDRTLAALQPLRKKTLLELGCGCGRFTHHLVAQGATVLAVDFSLGSLRRTAPRFSPDQDVALVCGDVTRFRVSPAAFDYALSTLTSNLPTEEHRAALNRLAADALKPAGSFVFSAHYMGLRERLNGEKKHGHYAGSGIYRYLFGVRELREETLRHFQSVTCSRIQVLVPILGRVKRLARSLARFGEHIPGLNLFAGLLLVTARRPRS